MKILLEEVLDREEILWKERAKTHWLAEGDRNTKFFHAQASTRGRINDISGLIGSDGQLKVDQQDVSTIVNDYFSGIFKSHNPSTDEIDDVINVMESRVDPAVNQELRRVFTPDEVKQALYDMFTLKSPGHDGLPALFYQRYCHIVGKMILTVC